MSPPWPPSPPEGPPRGTYFSLRNATQPLPPSPAFTIIFASSTNTVQTFFSAPSARFLCGLCVKIRRSPSHGCPWGKLKTRSPHPKQKKRPRRMDRGRWKHSGLTGGLCCLRRFHVHEPPTLAPVLEL